MNRINITCGFFLLFFLLACKPGKQLTSNSNEKEGNTISLFNGKNLNGWYTFIKDRGKNDDPKKVFTVHDGLLHVTGEEYGCVTSVDTFSNYKLVVEYKWGEKTHAPRINNARDNGVLLHSQGADGGYNGTWMHSIECQIIEGGSGDMLVVGDGSKNFELSSHIAPKQNNALVFQPGGNLITINAGRINWFGRDPEWKDVKGFRGKNDVEKPVGEWNRMECFAEQDKIRIFLNGVLVNEAENVKPSSGRIQVQSEGAEIFFRRVDLTLLNK